MFGPSFSPEFAANAIETAKSDEVLAGFFDALLDKAKESRELTKLVDVGVVNVVAKLVVSKTRSKQPYAGEVQKLACQFLRRVAKNLPDQITDKAVGNLKKAYAIAVKNNDDGAADNIVKTLCAVTENCPDRIDADFGKIFVGFILKERGSEALYAAADTCERSAKGLSLISEAHVDFVTDALFKDVKKAYDTINFGTIRIALRETVSIMEDALKNPDAPLRQLKYALRRNQL